MNRKVFVSSLLIIIMLMSMLIPVSANGSKIIMKMTNPADATSWEMGRYSGTAGTTDNADNTHTKIGDYAFKISDFYSKNNGVKAEFSGVAVDGATQAHLWVYGDVGTHTTVSLNATLMLKSGNKRITHKLVNGWQLITWSLTATESQSEITGFTFSSFGYGNEASND
ncbi:MAG: hypothetical protein IJB93_00480, partial [Clostridia bacterium]|nr:hypothetical protein [Clostridia bacterium]